MSKVNISELAQTITGQMREIYKQAQVEQSSNEASRDLFEPIMTFVNGQFELATARLNNAADKAMLSAYERSKLVAFAELQRYMILSSLGEKIDEEIQRRYSF